MSISVPRNELALKPIGAMRTSKALELLSAAGDRRVKPMKAGARKLKSDVKFEKFLGFWGGETPVYQFTDHQFGFVAPPGENAPQVLSIAEAANIAPDPTLQNQPLMITLGHLRVFDYPGGGRHTILVDFSAAHSTADNKQKLHFSQKYIALEGQGAGVRGYPIFAGLRSDSQGVEFRVSTVNVENDDDRKILAFMDSDELKQGLTLVNAVNPAIPVVTSPASSRPSPRATRTSSCRTFSWASIFQTSPPGPGCEKGHTSASKPPSKDGTGVIGAGIVSAPSSRAKASRTKGSLTITWFSTSAKC
jgi:hypothetical protein